MGVGDRFAYVYDFGDHWEHVIEVVSSEAVNGIAPGNGYITDGARSAPPEDVGGVPGYEDFLEQILARPLDEEGVRLLSWAGGRFDPELFDNCSTSGLRTPPSCACSGIIGAGVNNVLT